MRLTKRLLTALLFAAPLGAIALVAMLLMMRYWRSAERELGPLLETEATRALGHEVKVGKVTVAGGYVTIENVQLAEGKTLKESGAIAKAERVTLDFDLRRILFSKDKQLPLFATASVFRPTIQLRRSAVGTWNFTDIFTPPKGPPGRPAIGTVVVVDGSLDYFDDSLPHHAKRRAEPFVAHVHKVSGHLHLDSDRSSTWEARGISEAGYSLRVDGTYSSKPEVLYLDIGEKNGQLALANRFLPPDAHISAGMADVELHLLSQMVNGRPESHYSGHAIVTKGIFSSAYTKDPLLNIVGDVSFGEDVIDGNVSAQLAGSNVAYRGSMVNFTDPNLHGILESPSVDLQKAIAALGYSSKWPQLNRITANGNLKAWVDGPVANPNLRAESTMQVRGSAYDIQVGPKPAQVTAHAASANTTG